MTNEEARAMVERLRHRAVIGAQPIFCGEAADLIESLLSERDALARDAARVCLWSQDGDYESDTYGTSCGRYYCIIEGAPDENDMKYCCYCGGKLEQVLIEPDGGER